MSLGARGFALFVQAPAVAPDPTGWQWSVRARRTLDARALSRRVGSARFLYHQAHHFDPPPPEPKPAFIKHETSRQVAGQPLPFRRGSVTFLPIPRPLFVRGYPIQVIRRADELKARLNRRGRAIFLPIGQPKDLPWIARFEIRRSRQVNGRQEQQRRVGRVRFGDVVGRPAGELPVAPAHAPPIQVSRSENGTRRGTRLRGRALYLNGGAHTQLGATEGRGYFERPIRRPGGYFIGGPRHSPSAAAAPYTDLPITWRVTQRPPDRKLLARRLGRSRILGPDSRPPPPPRVPPPGLTVTSRAPPPHLRKGRVRITGAPPLAPPPAVAHWLPGLQVVRRQLHPRLTRRPLPWWAARVAIAIPGTEREPWKIIGSGIIWTVPSHGRDWKVPAGGRDWFRPED